MKISEEVLCLNDELIALRRDFHQHPEIGGQEFRTAEVVEKYLQDLGLETKRMADTGVVATLYGNRPNGKTILLRADMDALFVEEENEVPYKSVNPGVMHACGHDGHTAMLLVAAKVLCARKDELKGNVKFVFQPNEEVGAAHLMVRDGVLQNPSVDASFGLHLWSPIQSGVIGIKSGSVMAEMYNFKITLVGKDGHTSAPEASVDPIICAANIIQAFQTVQTREISSLKPTNIMFGKIQAGTSSNIIPQKLEMEGSLRYLYDGGENSEENPRKRMERIVKSVCEAHRIDGKIEFEVSNYILINDEKIIDFINSDVLPKMEITHNEIQAYQCLGGEDFSEYSNHNNIPGAFLFIGVGNEEKKTDRPHHSSTFNIDEDCLKIGVELFKNICFAYFDKMEGEEC